MWVSDYDAVTVGRIPKKLFLLENNSIIFAYGQKVIFTLSPLEKIDTSHGYDKRAEFFSVLTSRKVYSSCT